MLGKLLGKTTSYLRNSGLEIGNHLHVQLLTLFWMCAFLQLLPGWFQMFFLTVFTRAVQLIFYYDESDELILLLFLFFCFLCFFFFSLLYSDPNTYFIDIMSDWNINNLIFPGIFNKHLSTPLKSTQFLQFTKFDFILPTASSLPLVLWESLCTTRQSRRSRYYYCCCCRVVQNLTSTFLFIVLLLSVIVFQD